MLSTWPHKLLKKVSTLIILSFSFVPTWKVEISDGEGFTSPNNHPSPSAKDLQIKKIEL